MNMHIYIHTFMYIYTYMYKCLYIYIGSRGGGDTLSLRFCSMHDFTMYFMNDDELLGLLVYESSLKL